MTNSRFGIESLHSACVSTEDSSFDCCERSAKNENWKQFSENKKTGAWFAPSPCFLFGISKGKS